jgi:hypothetical protein
MRVSEKSLELNLGAELLWHLRHKWRLEKAYLRGLTQREERREGVDFAAHLSPSARIFAFQFKAPKDRHEGSSYRYTLVRYQHEQLHSLGIACPGSVFYVFPFYVTFEKLQIDVPKLMNDTWLLDVASMGVSGLFGKWKTRTITCTPWHATVNPEYQTVRSNEYLPLPQGGIRPDQFKEWYEGFRRLGVSEPSNAEDGRRSIRSPWLARGLRVIIASPAETTSS